MQRDEIERKINEFLVSDFEVDKKNLSPYSRLREDLGLDSLDFVDIVVVVKRVFGFVCAPEEMKSVITLGNLYDYIEGKLNGQKV